MTRVFTPEIAFTARGRDAGQLRLFRLALADTARTALDRGVRGAWNCIIRQDLDDLQTQAEALGLSLTAQIAAVRQDLETRHQQAALGSPPATDEEEAEHRLAVAKLCLWPAEIWARYDEERNEMGP